MTATSEEALRQYEVAARHMADIYRRWEQMVLSDPLEPGQEAWAITRIQVNLEDRIEQMWDDYIATRDAYLAAAGLEPA
jgi:hypothetical protein